MYLTVDNKSNFKKQIEDGSFYVIQGIMTKRYNRFSTNSCISHEASHVFGKNSCK